MLVEMLDRKSPTADIVRFDVSESLAEATAVDRDAGDRFVCKTMSLWMVGRKAMNNHSVDVVVPATTNERGFVIVEEDHVRAACLRTRPDPSQEMDEKRAETRLSPGFCYDSEQPWLDDVSASRLLSECVRAVTNIVLSVRKYVNTLDKFCRGEHDQRIDPYASFLSG